MPRSLLLALVLTACAHERPATVTQPSPAKAQEPSAPPPEEPLPVRDYTKKEIVAAMNVVKPDVQACYDRYRVAGVAIVHMQIAPSGETLSVDVHGKKLDGTAMIECVATAAKKVRMRALTRGIPFDFMYPYSFRDEAAQ